MSGTIPRIEGNETAQLTGAYLSLGVCETAQLMSAETAQLMGSETAQLMSAETHR